jgi:hypothetical protein
MTVREQLQKQTLEQEVRRWERVLSSTSNPNPIRYQLKRARARLTNFLTAIDSIS